MKVQTNTGEVELTAEMVRPGMVFEIEGAPWCASRFDDYFGCWQAIDGTWVHASRLGDWPLLGCDPAIAAREDVERYGVAPGIDAGARGFARLRGGGAVDLRREVPEGAIIGHDGERTGPFKSRQKLPRWLAGARLVGLHASHARLEDVERLCCGAAHPKTAPVGHGMAIALAPHVCTLAIGDHAEHEDIATGTRWPARVAPPDASKWTPIEGDMPVRCPQCRELALPGQSVWCSAKCRDKHAVESADVRRSLAAIGEAAKRRAAEAPLVALVAAVPEGLDPAGWRAAVLAVNEMCIRRRGADALDRISDVWKPEDTIALTKLAMCVGTVERPATDRTALDVAHRAYCRAVAPPGTRPVPERKAGGRAVRLVVDNGSDD